MAKILGKILFGLYFPCLLTCEQEPLKTEPSSLNDIKTLPGKMLEKLTETSHPVFKLLSSYFLMRNVKRKRQTTEVIFVVKN